MKTWCLEKSKSDLLLNSISSRQLSLGLSHSIEDDSIMHSLTYGVINKLGTDHIVAVQTLYDVNLKKPNNYHFHLNPFRADWYEIISNPN